MTRTRGFTLIELMIVVAVIAILAAIAYPSYQSYIVRSNRAAAQQFMLNAANRQEQYMLDRRQYATGANAAAILGELDLSIPEDVDNVYQMSFTVNAADFEITASPRAGTVQDGDGNLVLDSDGPNTPADHWN